MEWGELPPYRKWVYNSEGNKMRDPNSQRSITRDTRETKEKGKKGKGDAATTNLAKGGGKGGESLTAVKETLSNFPRE